MQHDRDSSEGDEARVNLSLAARPEQAALAREAVAEVAAKSNLHDGLTADAQLVVTEAFTNAVRHAYSEPEGEWVTVAVEADEAGISILVRDSGAGFRPHVSRAGSIGGLGIGLIAALSQRFELRRLPEGGTEVKARLEHPSPLDA